MGPKFLIDQQRLFESGGQTIDHLTPNPQMHVRGNHWKQCSLLFAISVIAVPSLFRYDSHVEETSLAELKLRLLVFGMCSYRYPSKIIILHYVNNQGFK